MSLILRLFEIDESPFSGWNLGLRVLQTESQSHNKSGSGISSGHFLVEKVKCEKISSQENLSPVNRKEVKSSTSDSLHCGTSPTLRNEETVTVTKGKDVLTVSFGESSHQNQETTFGKESLLTNLTHETTEVETLRHNLGVHYPNCEGKGKANTCFSSALSSKITCGRFKHYKDGNRAQQRTNTIFEQKDIPVVSDIEGGKGGLPSPEIAKQRMQFQGNVPTPSRMEKAKRLALCNRPPIKGNIQQPNSVGLDPDGVRGRLLRQKYQNVPYVPQVNLPGDIKKSTGNCSKKDDTCIMNAVPLIRPNVNQGTLNHMQRQDDNFLDCIKPNEQGQLNKSLLGEFQSVTSQVEPKNSGINENMFHRNEVLKSMAGENSGNTTVNVPKFINLKCPSCRSMQSVKNCPGTTHQCTGCANMYKVLDKAASSERGNADAKQGTIQPKKRPLDTTPRRTYRNNQKPECVTIISSDEEDNPSGNEKIESICSPDRTVKNSDKVNYKSLSKEINQDGVSQFPEKISKRMKLKGGQAPSTDLSLPAQDERVLIDVSFIQFGSVPGSAFEPMVLFSSGVHLKFGIVSWDGVLANKSDEICSVGSFSVDIKDEDINTVKLHVGRHPSMIILYPRDTFCSIVNEKFGQTILDTGSDDVFKKQILITFSRNPNSESEAENVVSMIKRKLGDYLQLISQKEAEHILKMIQNNETSNKVLNSNLHSASPKCTSGPPKTETILVYPKPAAHGSVTITVDDLDCLADGIYLNDVIIDFYLRYLLESKLAESDRARTHLFSSFFYKRLTQKASRHTLSEEKAKLSPAERMHQQVKNWTRNVDIFQKDFILIPVNEHSHWYLVIICFPAMVPLENDSVPQNITTEKSNISSDLSNMDTSDTDSSVAMETDEPTGNIQTTQDANTFSSNDNASSTNDSSKKKSICDKSDTQPLSALVGLNSSLDIKDSWNPMPSILIFDSLGIRTSNRVFTNFRNYLTQEWKTKRASEKLKIFDKDTMKGSFPKLPLQSNDCDCGIYLLQYAEAFFSHPIMNFKPPVKKENWFSKDIVSQKRNEIKNLILQLQKGDN